MSISLDVHLLSGKSASLEVEADASLESLKQCAQSALGAGKGRLLNASGEVLDAASTVTEAKCKSGDVLTLHVNPVQLRTTGQAADSVRLPHSWVIDLWLHGVVPTVVVTVVPCSRS